MELVSEVIKSQNRLKINTKVMGCVKILISGFVFSKDLNIYKMDRKITNGSVGILKEAPIFKSTLMEKGINNAKNKTI